MIVYKDLDKIEEMPETYTALGYFDGIHAGHQSLIEACVKDAKAKGVSPCVFTFSNSPKEALLAMRKEREGAAGTDAQRTPLALMTWDEKVRALEEMGVEYLVAPPFDRAVMGMSPEAFVRTLLVEKCHMIGAYCGFNYTFGFRAEGKPEDLKRMGDEGTLGTFFQTHIAPPFTMDGEVVSSTLVRSCVAKGDMARANAFLGHVFSLEGVTVPGRKIGTAIGFPTANFVPDPSLILPPDGVYATAMELDGAIYPAVTNVGTNPTVSARDGFPERRVETHLFAPPVGAGEDLYGKQVRVFFHKFLRGERTFSDENALREQIARDKKEAEEYWNA